MAKKGGKGDYDNSNRGALFVNDKDGNDKRPDFTGRINVTVDAEHVIENDDGTVSVECWLSAWQKQSKGGDDYLSLSVGKPVDAK